jgi:dihydrofolate reductase
MKNSKVFVIVAVEENFGIGKDGVMPWHFKCEAKYFNKVTTHVDDSAKQNAVFMGRTTWLSLPEKHRPLSGRKNIILTREGETPPDTKGCMVKYSPESAIEFLKLDESIETIFVIGGASIYKYAVENLDLDGLYITRVHKDYNCDTFFPRIPNAVYTHEQKLGEDEETGTKIEYFLYTK